MKSILKKLTQLVMLLVFCFQAFPSLAIQRVYCHIEFGNHRNENCRGFGFCRLVYLVDFGCELVTGDGGKTFTLNVPAEIVKKYETQFSGSFFLMENDFQLPSDILKAMGLSEQHLIKAGSYKMIKSGNDVTVYFN
ncbi:MAG TPA: hypothetical protein PLU53_03440 [Bacteroidia bacterium]|nr:hypothetical protein [Bacteroidia bacterium]